MIPLLEDKRLQTFLEFQSRNVRRDFKVFWILVFDSTRSRCNLTATRLVTAPSDRFLVTWVANTIEIGGRGESFVPVVSREMRIVRTIFTTVENLRVPIYEIPPVLRITGSPKGPSSSNPEREFAPSFCASRYRESSTRFNRRGTFFAS